MAHRLIGRWRLRDSGGAVIVKHVYRQHPRGALCARVSLGGLRQIVMRVCDLDALRKGGHLTYVGR